MGLFNVTGQGWQGMEPTTTIRALYKPSIFHSLHRFLNDLRRPGIELFRWHFRQAVLTNIRGAGEPDFENDFPPGFDMLADIRDGPKAAERMEFELFGRLAAHMDLAQ